jgi:HD-like signal output (HDOD) protein
MFSEYFFWPSQTLIKQGIIFPHLVNSDLVNNLHLLQDIFDLYAMRFWLCTSISAGHCTEQPQSLSNDITYTQSAKAVLLAVLTNVLSVFISYIINYFRNIFDIIM